LKQNNFKDKAYWIFIFVLKAKMAKWSQKVHQRSTVAFMKTCKSKRACWR